LLFPAKYDIIANAFEIRRAVSVPMRVNAIARGNPHKTLNRFILWRESDLQNADLTAAVLSC
jgi:hypothetical protein